jgi:hypothetical protein
MGVDQHRPVQGRGHGRLGDGERRHHRSTGSIPMCEASRVGPEKRPREPQKESGKRNTGEGARTSEFEHFREVLRLPAS